MQQLVGRSARFYDDWLAHPDYDAYWKPLNAEELFDRSGSRSTPSAAGSTSSARTLRGFVGMSQKGATQEARRGSHRDRPWGHGPSQKFGALDFGPEANGTRWRQSFAGTTTG
jgi:hypothetical protein